MTPDDERALHALAEQLEKYTRGTGWTPERDQLVASLVQQVTEYGPEPAAPRGGAMRVCGYCGSEIELDGEVLHLPDCTAPVPYGDEDAPNTDPDDPAKARASREDTPHG